MTAAARPGTQRRSLSGLALAVCCLLAWAPGAAAQEPEWLTGRLLVASQALDDPNFKETVVYMVEHDAGGAFGLVVNRPLGEMPLTTLMERLGEEARAAEGSIRVLSGGPVQPDKSFVLHSTDVMFADTRQVDAEIAVTAHPDALKAIGRGEGPREALLIVGYAGWAPGQLESEMARGSWEHVESDRTLLFDPDDAGKWLKAVERFTIDL